MTLTKAMLQHQCVLLQCKTQAAKAHLITVPLNMYHIPGILPFWSSAMNSLQADDQLSKAASFFLISVKEAAIDLPSGSESFLSGCRWLKD